MGSVDIPSSTLACGCGFCFMTPLLEWNIRVFVWILRLSLQTPRAISSTEGVMQKHDFRGWMCSHFCSLSFMGMFLPGLSFHHLNSRSKKPTKLSKESAQTLVNTLVHLRLWYFFPCINIHIYIYICIYIFIFIYIVWHSGSWGQGVLCSSGEDGKKMAIKRKALQF